MCIRDRLYIVIYLLLILAFNYFYVAIQYNPCLLYTSTQIEAARVAMTRYIKRGGKVWLKIFPDKPVTEKPAETRMGSGKGSPEYWVAVVKPGRVLFELADVDEATAREALRLATVSYTHLCV